MRLTLLSSIVINVDNKPFATAYVLLLIIQLKSIYRIRMNINKPNNVCDYSFASHPSF